MAPARVPRNQKVAEEAPAGSTGDAATVQAASVKTSKPAGGAAASDGLVSGSLSSPTNAPSFRYTKSPMSVEAWPATLAATRYAPYRTSSSR